MVSGASDIVVLRIPKGPGALPVVRVVISGAASRYGISVDRLDDLQLAAETLLADEAEEPEELTLTLSRAGDVTTVRLEGLRNESIKSALVNTGPFESCEGCPLDVRMLLGSLVDCYQVLEAAAGSFGIEMRKRTS